MLGKLRAQPRDVLVHNRGRLDAWLQGNPARTRGQHILARVSSSPSQISEFSDPPHALPRLIVTDDGNASRAPYQGAEIPEPSSCPGPRPPSRHLHVSRGAHGTGVEVGGARDPTLIRDSRSTRGFASGLAGRLAGSCTGRTEGATHVERKGSVAFRSLAQLGCGHPS